MALEVYKKKRDFAKTPEPKSGRPAKGAPLRFVIQRHEARRLHYDLRLEMEGVLKSWAVPKGPSLNPADKRLAVMTEDHPVDYLTFMGVIPKGNYGAGRMTIWDKGTYSPIGGSSEELLLKGLEKGDLKIDFEGEKVKGKFALVKIRGKDSEQNQWLLIKKKDEHAVDEAYDSEDSVDELYKNKEEPLVIKLNEFVRPMLAKKTSKAFDDPDWVFELKWDGYRAIASNLEGRVQLYSRNGLSFNEKFRPVTQALKQISEKVILDGEVVALDNNGRPKFQLLQNYQADPQGELRYYVFDLLHLNGHDITELPLTERKSLIPELIEGVPHLWYCDHIEGMGTAFFNKAAAAGMEGIIAKKADSTYTTGARTDKWLKIKTLERQETIICGFTEGKGSRKHFGSLILGIYSEGQLKYAGNCGGGFDEALLKEVYEQMKPLITKKSPFDKKINLKGRQPTWLKPELICEVSFSEWTKEGHMRHPIFKGMRNDKGPSEVAKEESVAAPKNKTAPAGPGSQQLEIDGHAVNFSNLDKLYWPDEGIRKYDMIEYYLAVSEYMVPYLTDRPENLHRHPEGIKKKGFYHKDTGEIMPYWIETIRVFSESNQKEINYMICQNTAALLYMANLGCIEINPWHSRKDNLLMPDYTIIDLDPSDKNTFEEVIETAQAVKEVLDKGKIPAWCKTSGSSGLHIVVPLDAQYDYDQARDFAKVICYMVHGMLPKITSMERNPTKRKDKIYLDFLQTRKGQTIAAPYCLRPKPGATASAPLEWKEVKKGLDKSEFNIHTMAKRLKKKGDLFKGVLGKGIDMEACLERLG